jgi:hypothetical protein
MSENTQRVLAFIQRAKELSSQPNKSPTHTPTRSITPQKSISKPPPVPSSISPLKSGRDPTPPSDALKSSKVVLSKPVGGKRVSPQKSITPKSRGAPSISSKPAALTPRPSESKGKSMPMESLTEIEGLVESLMKTRQNLDEKIKEQQEKEIEVINMIKESLSKNRAKEEQFDSVQAAEM